MVAEDLPQVSRAEDEAEQCEQAIGQGQAVEDLARVEGDR